MSVNPIEKSLLLLLLALLGLLAPTRGTWMFEGVPRTLPCDQFMQESVRGALLSQFRNASLQTLTKIAATSDDTAGFYPSQVGLTENYIGYYHGYYNVQSTMTMDFSLTADDCGVLLIDGAECTTVPNYQTTGTCSLALNGGYHLIEVLMDQNIGGHSMVLKWKGGSTASFTGLPPAHLHPPPPRCTFPKTSLKVSLNQPIAIPLECQPYNPMNLQVVDEAANWNSSGYRFSGNLLLGVVTRPETVLRVRWSSYNSSWTEETTLTLIALGGPSFCYYESIVNNLAASTIFSFTPICSRSGVFGFSCLDCPSWAMVDTLTGKLSGSTPAAFKPTFIVVRAINNYLSTTITPRVQGIQVTTPGWNVGNFRDFGADDKRSVMSQFLSNVVNGNPRVLPAPNFECWWSWFSEKCDIDVGSPSGHLLMFNGYLSFPVTGEVKLRHSADDSEVFYWRDIYNPTFDHDYRNAFTQTIQVESGAYYEFCIFIYKGSVSNSFSWEWNLGSGFSLIPQNAFFQTNYVGSFTAKSWTAAQNSFVYRVNEAISLPFSDTSTPEKCATVPSLPPGLAISNACTVSGSTTASFLNSIYFIRPAHRSYTRPPVAVVLSVIDPESSLSSLPNGVYGTYYKVTLGDVGRFVDPVSNPQAHLYTGISFATINFPDERRAWNGLSPAFLSNFVADFSFILALPNGAYHLSLVSVDFARLVVGGATFLETVGHGYHQSSAKLNVTRPVECRLVFVKGSRTSSTLLRLLYSGGPDSAKTSPVPTEFLRFIPKQSIWVDGSEPRRLKVRLLNSSVSDFSVQLQNSISGLEVQNAALVYSGISSGWETVRLYAMRASGPFFYFDLNYYKRVFIAPKVAYSQTTFQGSNFIQVISKPELDKDSTCFFSSGFPQSVVVDREHGTVMGNLMGPLASARYVVTCRGDSGESNVTFDFKVDGCPSGKVPLLLQVYAKSQTETVSLSMYRNDVLEFDSATLHDNQINGFGFCHAAPSNYRLRFHGSLHQSGWLRVFGPGGRMAHHLILESGSDVEWDFSFVVPGTGPAQSAPRSSFEMSPEVGEIVNFTEFLVLYGRDFVMTPPLSVPGLYLDTAQGLIVGQVSALLSAPSGRSFEEHSVEFIDRADGLKKTVDLRVSVTNCTHENIRVVTSNNQGPDSNENLNVVLRLHGPRGDYEFPHIRADSSTTNSFCLPANTYYLWHGGMNEWLYTRVRVYSGSDEVMNLNHTSEAEQYTSLSSALIPFSEWRFTDTLPAGSSDLLQGKWTVNSNGSYWIPYDSSTAPLHGQVTRYVTGLFSFRFLAIGDDVSAIQFRARFRGGLIVYMNGVEFFRKNLPYGPVSHGAPSIQQPPIVEEEVVFATHISLLRNGQNTLAIEIHLPSDNLKDPDHFLMRSARFLSGGGGCFDNILDPSTLTISSTPASTPGPLSVLNLFDDDQHTRMYLQSGLSLARITVQLPPERPLLFNSYYFRESNDGKSRALRYSKLTASNNTQTRVLDEFTLSEAASFGDKLKVHRYHLSPELISPFNGMVLELNHWNDTTQGISLSDFVTRSCRLVCAEDGFWPTTPRNTVATRTCVGIPTISIKRTCSSEVNPRWEATLRECPAPSTIRYASDLYTFYRSRDSSSDQPSYSQGLPTSFETKPALPEGLVISGQGVISGAASALRSGPTPYRVFAVNPYGNDSVVVNIQVKDYSCGTDGVFHETPVGEEVEISCPSGEVGIQRRRCSTDESGIPKWEDPFVDCRTAGRVQITYPVFPQWHVSIPIAPITPTIVGIDGEPYSMTVDPPSLAYLFNNQSGGFSGTPTAALNRTTVQVVLTLKNYPDVSRTSVSVSIDVLFCSGYLQLEDAKIGSSYAGACLQSNGTIRANCPISTTPEWVVESDNCSPVSVHYPMRSYRFYHGYTDSSDVPTIVGRVTSFSLGLKCGLSIDTESGRISGEPSRSCAQSAYSAIVGVCNGANCIQTFLQIDITTPTCSGSGYESALENEWSIKPCSGGSVMTGSISILCGSGRSPTWDQSSLVNTCRLKNPLAFSYKQTTSVFFVGQPMRMDPILESSDGSTRFSMIQSLPSGIRLNLSDGVVSGIPEEETDLTQYSISAISERILSTAVSMKTSYLYCQPTENLPKSVCGTITSVNCMLGNMTYVAVCSCSLSEQKWAFNSTICPTVIAPVGIKYGEKTFRAFTEVNFTVPAPLVIGYSGDFTRLFVEPELPEGLVFSPDGSIRGVPKQVQQVSSTHYVKACNQGESMCSAPVDITISVEVFFCEGTDQIPDIQIGGVYNDSCLLSHGYVHAECPKSASPALHVIAEVCAPVNFSYPVGMLFIQGSILEYSPEVVGHATHYTASGLPPGLTVGYWNGKFGGAVESDLPPGQEVKIRAYNTENFYTETTPVFSIQLLPTEKPTSGSNASSIGIIVGSCVGGVVVLTAVAVAWILVYKRCIRQKSLAEMRRRNLSRLPPVTNGELTSLRIRSSSQTHQSRVRASGRRESRRGGFSHVRPSTRL